MTLSLPASESADKEGLVSVATGQWGLQITLKCNGSGLLMELGVSRVCLLPIMIWAPSLTLQKQF